MKIIINRCYGGFSLSEKGLYKYAKLRGMKLYPQEGEYSHKTYWTVPPSKWLKEIDWLSASLEERKKYNEKYNSLTIYDRDIKRDDPLLVKVVEILGEEANGAYAKLEVVNVPSKIKWEIKEYDGLEHIAEVHRTWP